jgi:hypothetical protein
MPSYKEDNMSGYKHYIRTNEAGMIIYGFSSAFEQPLETDYLYAEEAPRHFHESFAEPLTNERGQYRFKVIDAEFIARSQEELDAEWQQQPPSPPTELDLIGAQLIQRELEALELRAENQMLGVQLVGLELRLFQLEGGV